MPSLTSQIPNLVGVGPVIEVAIGPSRFLVDKLKSNNQPIPQPVRVRALIDTGSTSTVIQPSVIQQLGISPIGITLINTPSCNNFECEQYALQIHFLSIPVMVETYDAIQAPLQGQNIQCLIGRDTLRHGLLIYNGYAQQITLSF